MILDVSDLESYSLDLERGLVTFGTGFDGAQLYYTLSPHGLSVAGGAAHTVGVGGLWLGGGRGPFSNIAGLACDSIVGVEYVDASGELQVALVP